MRSGFQVSSVAWGDRGMPGVSPRLGRGLNIGRFERCQSARAVCFGAVMALFGRVEGCQKGSEEYSGAYGKGGGSGRQVLVGVVERRPAGCSGRGIRTGLSTWRPVRGPRRAKTSDDIAPSAPDGSARRVCQPGSEHATHGPILARMAGRAWKAYVFCCEKCRKNALGMVASGVLWVLTGVGCVPILAGLYSGRPAAVTKASPCGIWKIGKDFTQWPRK